MKRVISVFLTVCILLTNCMLCLADGSYRTHQNWVESSFDDVTDKYYNGEKFIMFYYRVDGCSNSDTIGDTVIAKWMDDGEIIYGVDCDASSIWPQWFCNEFPDLSTSLPVIMFFSPDQSIQKYCGMDGSSQEAWDYYYAFTGRERPNTDVDPGDCTPVYNIALSGFEAPIIGKTASNCCNVTTPLIAQYYISDCFWYDDTESRSMVEGDVFQEGHSYSEGVFVKPDDGCCFSDVTYTILDDSCTVDTEITSVIDSELFLLWSVSTPAVAEGALDGEPIDTVWVSGYEAPILGETSKSCNHITIPENMGYSIERSGWYDDTESVWLGDDDVFVEDHSYSEGVWLLPDSGYVFTKDVSYTIGDDSCVVDTAATGKYEDHFCLWSVSVPASEDTVAFTVEAVYAQVNLLREQAGMAGLSVDYYTERRAQGQADSFQDTVSAYTKMPEGDFGGMWTYVVDDACYVIDDSGAVHAVNECYNSDTGRNAITSNAFVSMGCGYNEELKAFVLLFSENASGGNCGDANADGVVNMKDVLAIRKYVANISVAIDEQNADANIDGTVNMKDVLLVRKVIAGLDSFPTAPERPEPTSPENTKPTPEETPTEPSGDEEDPEDYSMPDKEYFYDSDGNVSHWYEYTYDENGHRTSQRHFNADGSMDWKEAWDSTYDENGYCLSDCYYDDDGNVRLRIERIFDENGNEINRNSYNGDGSVIWEDSFECVFTEDGRFLSHRNYTADGSGLGWGYEYTYDAAGKVVKETYYDDDGAVSAWYEYAYDANGIRISQRCYNPDGSMDWEYSWDETYDENGNITSHRSYNADGSVLQWYEYTYNEDGKETALRYYDADGSLSRWYEYLYDENGYRTGQHRYFADGSIDWESSWDSVYDENGHCTTEYYYAADGSIEVCYVYTYDANGYRTSQRRYFADGSVDWENSWDHIYNENGYCICDCFYLADGSVDCRTEFTYDSHGNLLTERSYDGNGNLRYSREYTF